MAAAGGFGAQFVCPLPKFLLLHPASCISQSKQDQPLGTIKGKKTLAARNGSQQLGKVPAGFKQKPALWLQFIHIKTRASLPKSSELLVLHLGVVLFIQKFFQAFQVMHSIKAVAVAAQLISAGLVWAAVQPVKAQRSLNAGHLSQGSHAAKQQCKSFGIAFPGLGIGCHGFHFIQKGQQGPRHIVALGLLGPAPVVIEYIHTVVYSLVADVAG